MTSTTSSLQQQTSKDLYPASAAASLIGVDKRRLIRQCPASATLHLASTKTHPLFSAPDLLKFAAGLLIEEAVAELASLMPRGACAHDVAAIEVTRVFVGAKYRAARDAGDAAAAQAWHAEGSFARIKALTRLAVKVSK